MHAARVGASALVAASLALLVLRSVAIGHPMGTFSVSVYSRLLVEQRQINVRWVLDMGELPSAAVVDLIDADANGQVSPAERHAYLATWVSSILDAIEVTLDGEPLRKRVDSHELALPGGEGGAPALRVVLDLTAELPVLTPGRAYDVRYEDSNYVEYPGWREVIVQAGDHVALVESSVPAQDQTDELRNYAPVLSAAAANSVADFTFEIAGPAASGGSGPGPSGAAELSTGARPGFSLWPTGVLALLVLGALAVVIVVVERKVAARDGPRRSVR